MNNQRYNLLTEVKTILEDVAKAGFNYHDMAERVIENLETKGFLTFTDEEKAAWPETAGGGERDDDLKADDNESAKDEDLQGSSSKR